ncbi:aminopeptidase N isoform X3 [Episyrphus balteatus]|uniref:aminopeptidase N isoform X3 n=1 Tax=Episyrphus balteatus TaxID=286459 RepID=UPI0024861E51|nr:aminopeptidase N isoform X3 [Episyrphus balteatus]
MDGGYINEEDSDAIIGVDSPGGQLKTKNGQKYVLNGKPERMTRSFAILSGCVLLLAILIAILITYFITASAYSSKGCLNGHSASNYNNHHGGGENFSATIASASTFGMPSSSRSPGTNAAVAEGHDPYSNESNKQNDDNPIDRKLQLYEGWTPEIYKILIEPNLSTSTSNGTVSVLISRDYSVKGLQPIVFDVNNITILEARVVRSLPDDNDLDFESDYGENNTTFVIKVQKDVEAEKNLKLVVYLDFVSEITSTLQGIYKTSYINSETLETEWMISTQFSPIDARRGFPCFDRPDKKANFSISIIHEQSKTTALSNMPSKRITKYRPGYVKEDFEITPKMPTYLVAFIVSNLVKANYSNSDRSAKTQIEFYTRSEGTDMTTYAYDVTRKILPFFESYFGIEYKLPKIDMVSVPDFGFGAMENWGLITFRDSSLLVPEDQEKTSSAEHTEYVASIISHELAHQWFGNLVTPKWWDDLWLKEGFATYMSYIATDSIHSEWKIMDTFTVFEFQQSMDKDSDNSSHPITFDVESINDIRRIFDPISYSKSTILLRMLNSIVGHDAFRDATREFLKTFQYKNANRNDLWSFMTFQAHAKRTLPLDIHIKDIMNTWISQAGYPVVTVKRNETKLVITQQRYMLPQKNDTDDTRWYIPITFETDESKKGDDIPTHYMLPDDKEIVIDDVFSDSNSSDIVVYLNLNRQGYYRVNYDYESWIVLKKKFSTLPSITRAQLLDDSFHLAQAEYLTYDIPLTFLLEMYTAVEDELLWASSQHGLNYMIFMLHREPAYETFRAFMRFIVRPAFDHYGLNEPSDATHTQLMHRARVARMACKFNYDRCTTAAQLKYREWMTNKTNMIKPNLKEIIYCTTLAEGSYQEWYFAYKQYKRTTSASEKEQILIALGCTQKPWLLSKYLNMTIDPSSGILKQDGARAFSAVAQNPIGFEIAFDFLATNIKEISEYFGDGFSTLTKMIDSITSFMNKDYHREQLERFAIRARKLGLTSVENTIQLAMEQVNNNIYWRNRSYYSLKGFLEAIVSEFRINIF